MTVDWTQRGPCRTGDPDRFFVDNLTNDAAAALCRGCPIVQACGEYALRHELYGVWGGMTRLRRRAIQAKARTAAPNGPQKRKRKKPVRALALLRRSERLIAAGATVETAAKRLRVSRGYLLAARARARRHLAGVAS
ncbi:WhiB family transcriptional regulator [Streptosporangium sp. NPDC051023]|uniref:WhiB family transcriptional regulator n=1 Tax=Streptosporangium sp. NPDC051023 TaxID=3155410 RepID=UPI0034506F10